MKVTQVSVDTFRNLKEIEFFPKDGVNVIFGENGQGKTNLLEAIWLFSGAKSFRGAKEAELIPIGAAQAAISLRFGDSYREHLARIRMGENREIVLDSMEMDSFPALSGNFCCVVFSPVHLSLIKGGPAERRKSIDTVIGQVKPRYLSVLAEYQRLLMQRSALLKDAMLQPALLETLEIWDDALAKTGALVTVTRKTFIERLTPFSQEIYHGISTGREDFSLRYLASIEAEGEISKESMKKLLQERRTEDLRTGNTSVGPHRDDLEVLINGISARSFGSQGQQRSGVLALKFAESALIEQVTNQPPVILLDDVMSELDELRRNYLLHRLGDRQIFITCCDPAQVAGVDARFLMSGGRLTAQS